jgi:hypothetical protein
VIYKVSCSIGREDTSWNAENELLSDSETFLVGSKILAVDAIDEEVNVRHICGLTDV